MINKRLMGAVGGTGKYIAGVVFCQWIGMLSTAACTFAFAFFLQHLLKSPPMAADFTRLALIVIPAVVIRALAIRLGGRFGFMASKAVKRTLRHKIYEKLTHLGTAYEKTVSPAEVVQLSVEGVEQLETYFGAFMPQLFYSVLAPLTLFIGLSFISLRAAAVLLSCVPIIPIAIAAVQTFAKKLLSKYWKRYTGMGDAFLENLRGLTTLKIYQTDAHRHTQMNEEAETFRRITMKVLRMQLNSITIMDIVAFGGAALGIVLAVLEFAGGRIGFAGCFAIILLSAEFFIPMRQLGSYFHIAMNGMAASEKMFRLLDMPDAPSGTLPVPAGGAITLSGVHFSYVAKREILSGIDMAFPPGSFHAIVGESGCGKSTIASLLTGQVQDYSGSIKIGDTELCDIDRPALLAHITYISHSSYLFKGSVRENLMVAAPGATDDDLWAALARVNLAQYLQTQAGLDTVIEEGTANFSGGQRQRLCLARALLHNSPVYIFDEATSNVDVESENIIVAEIHRLAKTKTVIFISHRLSSIQHADGIYVMDGGKVCEAGKHEALLIKSGVYATLWHKQAQLEAIGAGGEEA